MVTVSCPHIPKGSANFLRSGVFTSFLHNLHARPRLISIAPMSVGIIRYYRMIPPGDLHPCQRARRLLVTSSSEIYTEWLLIERLIRSKISLVSNGHRSACSVTQICV